MTVISLRGRVAGKDYVLLPFYKDGKPLARGARWGMTLRRAGTMRFRWNEANGNRERTLAAICGEKQPVSLELTHSKTVYDIAARTDTAGRTGDGMISRNAALVPVVTVADCVPIFLYDEHTRVFGVCHSGWKGTGIIAQALALAQERYGTEPRDVCVAIGPHIHACCYTVDAARAAYFAAEFTPGCVEREDGAGSVRYRLSLAKANEVVLARAGVRAENIVCADDCTACARDSCGDYPFGSFRRQAAAAHGLSADERSRAMTVQAAFVGWL